MTGVVIIGAGHASGQLVASLRQGGWEGDITLIGEEEFLPYQRPPLSKKYLAGEMPLERLFVRPEEFYETQNVKLHVGVSAESIDRAQRQVKLADGTALAYEKLVLSTGARVRRIDCPGAELQNIFYLRGVADVDAIKTRFKDGARLVIVGAGYIGLEVAAVAANRGVKVTVLEAADRVMARVTSPTVSSFFEEEHRKAGVDIRLNAMLRNFEGEGAVRHVVTEAGERFEADFVIVGVGVLPNEELAAEAGLKTDNGIWVDEYTQTSDETVYAVGDCTNHPNALLGRRLRLESVHNALEQAKTCAAAICGAPKPYAQAPWFWSDQYDLKLQTVGLSQGFDEEILRGDPDDRKFAVFYLREGELIAVDTVNMPAEFMASKMLIGKVKTVDQAALADPAFSLKSLL